MCYIFGRAAEQTVEFFIANVLPIHKKDERQQINNYRPVSLLSNISNVMERIVHNALYSYCTK